MPSPLLLCGDYVPDFVCAGSPKERIVLNGFGGRYVFVSFLGSLAVPDAEALMQHVKTKHKGLFDDLRATFMGVFISDQSTHPVAVDVQKGIYCLWDVNKEVSALFGAIDTADTNGGGLAYRPFTLVLDPMLRVYTVIRSDNVENHKRMLDEVIAKLPPLPLFAGMPIHAPVIILSRVLEPELCRELISYYDKHGGARGKISNSKGEVVENEYIKRRFDCPLNDESLVKELFYRITHRVTPALQLYFQYKAEKLLHYIIGCYDSSENGHFTRHRDHSGESMKRRFAMTINLNTEEYEGGALCFPEFGNVSYNPPSGSGVAFSCNLLHEALPVTKGKRYMLPLFFRDSV